MNKFSNQPDPSLEHSSPVLPEEKETDGIYEDSSETDRLMCPVSLHLVSLIWKLQKDTASMNFSSTASALFQAAVSMEDSDEDSSSSEDSLPYWVQFPIFESFANTLLKKPVPGFPEFPDQKAAENDSAAEIPTDKEEEKTAAAPAEPDLSGDFQTDEGSPVPVLSSSFSVDEDNQSSLSESDQGSSLQIQNRSAEKNKRGLFGGFSFRKILQQLFSSFHHRNSSKAKKTRLSENEPLESNHSVTEPLAVKAVQNPAKLVSESDIPSDETGPAKTASSSSAESNLKESDQNISDLNIPTADLLSPAAESDQTMIPADCPAGITVDVSDFLDFESLETAEENSVFSAEPASDESSAPDAETEESITEESILSKELPETSGFLRPAFNEEQINVIPDHEHPVSQETEPVELPDADIESPSVIASADHGSCSDAGESSPFWDFAENNADSSKEKDDRLPAEPADPEQEESGQSVGDFSDPASLPESEYAVIVWGQPETPVLLPDPSVSKLDESDHCEDPYPDQPVTPVPQSISESSPDANEIWPESSADDSDILPGESFDLPDEEEPSANLETKGTVYYSKSGSESEYEESDAEDDLYTVSSESPEVNPDTEIAGVQSSDLPTGLNTVTDQVQTDSDLISDDLSFPDEMVQEETGRKPEESPTDLPDTPVPDEIPAEDLSESACDPEINTEAVSDEMTAEAAALESIPEPDEALFTAEPDLPEADLSEQNIEPDPALGSAQIEYRDESINKESEQSEANQKSRSINTKAILGEYQADWVHLRPLGEFDSAEEAVRQTDIRLQTKHNLGLDLLKIAHSPGLVKMIHQKAKSSVNWIIRSLGHLGNMSQFEIKEFLKVLDPAAIALSMSIIALDSDYRSLSADAEKVYGLRLSDHSNFLRVLRLISDYYGLDEKVAPVFYLRQCVITRGNRDSFARLMFEIYSQILEKELPENLEDVLGSVFADYVRSLNEESIEEQEFKIIYQTVSLKELFVTPFWHPELIQYSSLFLRYIDAFYWQKPTDDLPYQDEFESFFTQWFEDRQKKLEKRTISETHRKIRPKWKAFFRLISDPSGSMKICLTTKTFYLAPDQKTADYRVSYFSGDTLLATEDTLHSVIHLRARFLNPISISLDNPFADISYSLFYKDELTYSSGNSMFRKWIFFDDDGNETDPKDHLGEALWIALPGNTSLPGIEIYQESGQLLIGRTDISEELLLSLFEATDLAGSNLAAGNSVEKFSASLAGTLVPYAAIHYGKQRFPIYSSIHGINCSGNEYSLSDFILEVDNCHKEIESDLDEDETGRYVTVIRLDELLETGFHQIRIIPKKGKGSIASFRIFLDTEAPENTYMVFNPKLQKFSYSNFTDLHEEINDYIDLSKNHLISTTVHMSEFSEPLDVYYPAPLPFYRIGENGEWMTEQTPLSIEQVEYETHIYVDGVYSEEIEVVNDNKVLKKLPILEDDNHMRYFECSSLLSCIFEKPCSPVLLFRTASNEKDYISFTATSTARVIESRIRPDFQSAVITVESHGPHPVRMKVLQRGKELFCAEDLSGTLQFTIEHLIDAESCQVVLEGYSDDLFSPFPEYLIRHVKCSFGKFDTSGFTRMPVKGARTKKRGARTLPVEHISIFLPDSWHRENGSVTKGYLTLYPDTPSRRERFEIELKRIVSIAGSDDLMAELSVPVSNRRLVCSVNNRSIMLQSFASRAVANHNDSVIDSLILGQPILERKKP